MVERSKAVRWKPEDGRPQTGVPAAPTFRPTTEEFKDPVAYIDSIRPQAEKCALRWFMPSCHEQKRVKSSMWPATFAAGLSL